MALQGTVVGKHGLETIVAKFGNEERYIPAYGIMDTDGEMLETLEYVMVGDIISIADGCYYIQKPSLFEIELIQYHQNYESFCAPGLVEFSHYRKVQYGDRGKHHMVGLSLLDIIYSSKRKNIINIIKSFTSETRTQKFFESLEKEIRSNSSIQNLFQKLQKKMLNLEEASKELLRVKYGEENLFRDLNICFCKYNLNLQYIGGNNLYSEDRINVIEGSQREYYILYSRLFYNENLYDSSGFFRDTNPLIPCSNKRDDLKRKILRMENNFIELTEKLVHQGRLTEVYPTLNFYFQKQETASSQKFKSIIFKLTCNRCNKIHTDHIITLECGHVICKNCFEAKVLENTDNKIVMTLEESLNSQPLTCDVCFLAIEEDVKKKNILNYNKYFEEAKRREVRSCLGCSNRYPLTSYHQVCQHYCQECLLEHIRRKAYNCFVCNLEIPEDLIKKLKKNNSKCEKCEKSLLSIHCFPYKLCSHLYCYPCANRHLDSSFSWNCEFCYPVQLHNDAACKYLRDKCIDCPVEVRKSNDLFMYKSCDCVYCDKCMSKSTEMKCRNCGVPFSGYIEYLVNEEIERQKKLIRVCPICTNEFNYDDIIKFFECGHEMCENCLKESIKTNINSDIMAIFRCYNCSNNIDVIELEAYLSPHKKNIFNNQDDEDAIWNKILHRTLQLDKTLIECPNCRTMFMPDIIRRVYCFHCKFVFCKSCNEEYHEDGSACHAEFIRKRIADIEVAMPGSPISQCPKCKTPSLKDDKCNHVNCANCKTSYCFVCAAIRDPILCHGNHYHRPQCADYSPPGTEADVMKPKCSECTRLGQLCPRPRDLQIRGRIGEGEE